MACVSFKGTGFSEKWGPGMMKIFKALSVVLSFFLLADCAPPATKLVDPLASLNIGTTPRISEYYYYELSVALIMSENTKNTIEQLKKWNGMMILNPAEQVDTGTFFKGVADIFKKYFRNVTTMQNIEEARKLNVDIIAVLDINMELSNWVFNPTKTTISSILLIPDKTEIDTVRAKGVANGHGALALTIAEAKINFDNALLASKKLQAFSKAKSPSLPLVAGNSGRADKLGSLESVSFTPAIKSDVDELPAAIAKSRENSYAIVIGIETYRQKLPKADFAVSDAKLVNEYLTKVMGYPEENVIALTNEHASKSDFEKYIEEWLPKNMEPDSSVFIYYSGHGAPNSKTGDAFLVPYDGDPNFIEKTGYPLKKLYQNLAKLQAKEIIVVLDSCFSGAGGRSVLAQGSRPLVMNLQTNLTPTKNMIIMAASSGYETSSTYNDKGHGLFTYFLLKGIKGEADTNKDGKMEIEELYQYLKPQVQKIARRLYNNEQTPQLITPVDAPMKIFLWNK